MDLSYHGLVLCAGRGTRMRPFAPKEALPFLNDSIIGHGITSLKHLGIHRINIVVGEGKYTIQELVGNGRSYGVRVSYDFQMNLDGDAGGIRSAYCTEDSNADAAFILFGDTVFETISDLELLKQKFEMHYENPAYIGAIAFKKLKGEIPAGAQKFPYGVAEIDKDGFITRIQEKPALDELDGFQDDDGNINAIAPAYVFKKNDLFRIVKLLYQEKLVGEKHLSDAVHIAIEKYNFKVSGTVIQKEAFDLGRPYPYMAAQRDFFKNINDEELHRLAKEWEGRGDNNACD